MKFELWWVLLKNYNDERKYFAWWMKDLVHLAKAHLKKTHTHLMFANRSHVTLGHVCNQIDWSGPLERNVKMPSDWVYFQCVFTSRFLWPNSRFLWLLQVGVADRVRWGYAAAAPTGATVQCRSCRVPFMVHSDLIAVHRSMSADTTCSLSQQLCALWIFVRVMWVTTQKTSIGRCQLMQNDRSLNAP